MRRTTKRTWWVRGSVAAAAIALGIVAWQNVKRSYSSEFMEATWVARTAGSDPGVAGQITGWNGRPEVGQQVQAETDTGAATAVTNGDGRFELAARGELSRLTVVGIDAVPLTPWNRRGRGGLSFDIHLKRPAAPSRGPL